ncbi:hypothetical protein [Salipiger bermudensis]|uniref:hypothetical protein n=1 Tax=Salipiger bermudensis TaxID=344736 RepID=UPI003008B28B
MCRTMPCLLAFLTTPAIAQDLDDPFATPRGNNPEVEGCHIHYVDGLDPNGDGFLAVRTGPGSGHRKIDEVHNGDAVYTCVGSGPWRGIVYTGESLQNNHRDQHLMRRGWVHSNWLMNGAG